MRAVICHQLGSVADLVLEERPTPEPGPGQVRIAVGAAGASYVDGLRVAGRYQFPMTPPYVPGGEAAGTIDAIGEGVDGWAIGDRVFAVVASGAFADTLLAKPHQLIRLPDSVDIAVGASFYQVYGTAWFALTRRTEVRPGETMLVTGAGGGVGLAAIDVARHLGARVIAIASSPEKRALALSMGAEVALDPADDDVKARARELTDGKGVDLVYDVVGGELSEQCLRAMAFDGRFLIVGFTAGIGRVPLNLVLLNNRTAVGVEWGGWVQRNAAANREMMAEVVDAIASGALQPVAPTQRPLSEAGAVLGDLLERRAVGKLVLVP